MAAQNPKGPGAPRKRAWRLAPDGYFSGPGPPAKKTEEEMSKLSPRVPDEKKALADMVPPYEGIEVINEDAFNQIEVKHDAKTGRLRINLRRKITVRGVLYTVLWAVVTAGLIKLTLVLLGLH